MTTTNIILWSGLFFSVCGFLAFLFRSFVLEPVMEGTVTVRRFSAVMEILPKIGFKQERLEGPPPGFLHTRFENQAGETVIMECREGKHSIMTKKVSLFTYVRLVNLTRMKLAKARK